jgi:DNA polymerase elongation subunit (family B)
MLRHSDACQMAKEFQKKAIMLLLDTDDIYQGRKNVEKLFDIYLERLRKRDFSLSDFIIRTRLGKIPGNYTRDAPHVVASRYLRNPGRYIDYIFSISGPVPAQLCSQCAIDCSRYAAMLRRAKNELLSFMELPL